MDALGEGPLGRMVRKVCSEVNTIDRFDSFTVIGDPGCDGLGAETMSVFAKALSVKDSDFGIIAGDIVPFGSDLFYRNVTAFVDSVSASPMWLVCGNHDTRHYDEYFGLRNYLICDDRTLIVVLDDSSKTIDSPAVEFLKSALEGHRQENVVIITHIPPPNSFSDNSLPAAEWAKARAALLPHKDRIKFIVAAHVHSYFEDVVDGMRLIVTGGGGARLEPLERPVPKDKAYHHVVRFHYDEQGRLARRHVSLDGNVYGRELSDERLKAFLTNAFQNECMAHVRYKIFADDAERKGLDGIAKLFRAAADAERVHARNHFHALGRLDRTRANVESSMAGEHYEVSTMYKEYLDYAQSKGHGLAAYAFHDAMEAEKIHYKLFREAAQAEGDGDIPERAYFTCGSCGHTFREEAPPHNCPVCGAPSDKINEVD